MPVSTTDKTVSLYDSPSSPADGAVPPEKSSAQPSPEVPTSAPAALPVVAATVEGASPEAAASQAEPASPSDTAPAGSAPEVAAPEPAVGLKPMVAPEPQTPPEPQPQAAPVAPPAFAPSPERVGGPADQTSTIALGSTRPASGEEPEPGKEEATPTHPGTARRAAESVTFNEPAGQGAQAQPAHQAQPGQDDQEAQALAERQEAEQRARERAERDRRLGTVHADEQAEPVVPAVAPKPTTDKFFGSVGLFVLRLVTAALVGVYGFQSLTQRQPVIDTIARIGVPQASTAAWVFAGLLLLVALMILFGFATRVAGFILAALGVVMLVFVKWGAFNPFRAGQPGFSGDIELLLVGVGWLLLFIGAGGWSLDAGMRRSRAKRKLESQI